VNTSLPPARRLVKLALLALVIIGGLVGTLYASYHGYIQWRQARLLRQTRDHLARADLKQAVLTIRQAIQNAPNDVPTCRLMAEVAERASSPVAVFYRQRLVELQPEVSTNRVQLAKTALAFSDYRVADQALKDVPESARQNFDYHWAAAHLCLPTRRELEAETHLLAAMQCAPTNTAAPLKLAALRLQANDTNRQHQARVLLLTLRTNATAHADALRMLAEDAGRTGQGTAALAYSAELFKRSEEFPDSLLRLEVVHRFQRPDYAELLVSLQARARENPAQAFALAQWLRSAGQADAAEAWLKRVPEPVRRQLPLAPLYAGALDKEADWAGLAAFVRGQQWGRRESTRLLFAARAQRGLGNPLAGSVEWRQALKTAGKDPLALRELAEITEAWKWDTELLELLWQMHNQAPKDKAIFLALTQQLIKAGNTASLRTLFSRASEAEPDNLALKNNLVMTSLLLNGQDKASHQLARELFAAAPANPVIVSTYAFSLYLQKQPAAALAAFAQLQPEQLMEPNIAAYYGLVLVANGRAAEAGKFLQAARRARLLPEETALLAANPGA
jgi:predicted Zn-dependent protease